MNCSSLHSFIPLTSDPFLHLPANITHYGKDDEINGPRDAGGLVIANGGRHLLNFGGVVYDYHPGKPEIKRYRRRTDYSIVRAFDVCTKAWSKVGDLGAKTFAVQTAASVGLNMAFTCGGEGRKQHNQNNPWCFVNRIPGMKLENHRVAARA